MVVAISESLSGCGWTQFQMVVFRLRLDMGVLGFDLLRVGERHYGLLSLLYL